MSPPTEEEIEAEIRRQWILNGDDPDDPLMDMTEEEVEEFIEKWNKDNKQNIGNLGLWDIPPGDQHPQPIPSAPIPNTPEIPPIQPATMPKTNDPVIPLRTVNTDQSKSPEEYYNENKGDNTDRITEAMEVLGDEQCMGVVLFIQKEGNKVQATDTYRDATGEISTVSFEDMDETFMYGANAETHKLQQAGIVVHNIPTQSYYISDWGARVLRSMDAASEMQREADRN